MFKLPLLSWIGNAAAVLCGNHGDVTKAAADAGCSRQTAYDHAHKVERAVADARLPGPCRERLLQENAALRKENQELWDAYLASIDFPQPKQQQFATTACAMGLSLSQALVLLAILLPPSRLPSRATLGRWVNHSARTAGRLLAILDKACRPLVLSLCLDEIFFCRKPVLMAVEPHSLAWVTGQRALDRSGETWDKALAAWPQLEDVAADGGTGIERGLQLARDQRQQAALGRADGHQARPIHARLDVFHIRRDGARAMRGAWGRAEALWEEAEKVERAKRRFDRRGTDQREFNKAKVDKPWAEAEAAFVDVCRQERAWARAVAALSVWRPDGQLNDREWAQAELQAAAQELTGPAWAKVRRQLLDERALIFLDRLHEELEAAEADPQRREGLVALWRLRGQSRRPDRAGQDTAVQVVGDVLVEVVKAQLGEGWEESYSRVSRVLKRVLRASSCVECVNSVVRMHQARHRNLSQELLDLKRLYWNCRTFVEGKHKKHCPYQLLGLNLPSFDPWALLQMDPVLLEQLLSSPRLAP
jgi:hypothetical protein